MMLMRRHSYPGWLASLRHSLTFEQHAVASAVPAQPGTCSGSSRCALDTSAIGAYLLIIVVLALHV